MVLGPSGCPAVRRGSSSMKSNAAALSAAIGVLGIAFGGLIDSARATHDEPGRGRAIRGSLVTSYKPCTSPNTMTEGGLPQPACAPPERSDPVCGFGALEGM